MSRIKIEALTVCVGYCDFLAEIEPFNRPHLDRWLIVTTERDEETRDFCWRRNLECLLTDDFTKSGNTFDKALAIDHGMQLLSCKDYLLHLDADIVLPPQFRESLMDAHLDPACIHGFDRFMIRGWDRWQKLKASGYFSTWNRGSHHNVCFPETFPVGARWADVNQGWVPIGFSQLWHGPSSTYKGMTHRRYPAHGHNDAARSDVQFGLKWDRRRRILIPEVIVGHLESDGNSVGANWSGRTTARFGAPVNPVPATVQPQQAASHHHKPPHHHGHHHHHHKHHHHGY